MKPKKTITPFVLFFIMGMLFLSGCATVGDKASAGPSPEREQVENDAGGAIVIRDVVLEKIQGKERVSILLSDATDFEISRESDTTVLITLKGVSVAEGADREYRGGGLRNLQRAVLYNTVTEAEKTAGVRLVVKRMVPYRYKKEGQRVVVDFDVAALSSEAVPDEAYAAKALLTSGAERGSATRRNDEAQPEKVSRYTGEDISLDFQDADIKSVFRLLSEISGLSIVAGPDVKAEVTVHMKNVPWDQALDAVLEINGLGKKQSGKVITVLPLEELKNAEEEQKKKGVVQDRLNKISQISIEAKIVEVSTTFAREMGIRWGGGLQSGNFAMGMGSASTGTPTSIGAGIGLIGSNVAVNFPSTSIAAGAVTAPAIGLLFGTSKMILDAKLSALESTGDGKIISSPKITTLDGVEATISQGKKVPYQVPATADTPAYAKFEKVALELKVTPTITPDGRISMIIYATNQELDWPNAVLGMPAIDESSVDSKIIVKNGDTVVVGGIYKTIISESVEGVPWLSKIPVLGWLFKYKTVSNDKRELLIFVTPKIIEERE